MTRGEVHFWYRFTESLDDAEAAADAAVLSADERARADRFVFARDRRDFVAAHALLRRSLSICADVRPADWTFTTGAHGKPSVAAGSDAPPLAFNLSHTQGLVACAVALDGEIGIDVESAGRVASVGALAARFFSAGEIAHLDACAGSQRGERFIELWTLKESYIKAIGTGLSHPLDSFEFDIRNPAAITMTAPADTGVDNWTFALMAPSPQYRLALAARRSGTTRCRLIPHVP